MKNLFNGPSLENVIPLRKMFSSIAICALLAATSHSSSENRSPKPFPPFRFPVNPDDYCDGRDKLEPFDFIVVGAGPGGATVARRLAENPKFRILLLDAGGNPSPLTEIPITAGGTVETDRFQYGTTDKNFGFGYPKNSCPIKPGKNLGGSSTVNTMMGFRGNKKDFDEWEELGCTGWSYKDILPYFKKSENYIALPISDEQTDRTVSSKYHSRGGPMTTDFFPIDPQTEGIRQGIIQSAVKHGIPFNIDSNGESQMGVTLVPSFVNADGFRYSVVKGYLQNIPDNLKVCKHALVDKVIFEGLRAVGVESRKQELLQSKKIQIRAKKEVILSAGAFNSALIMERSGIGQCDLLDNLDIPCIVDSKNVGEKLMDHYANFVPYKMNFQPLLSNPFSNGLTVLSAFINTQNASSDYPDAQWLLKTYSAPAGIVLGFKPKIQAELVDKQVLIGTAVLRQGIPGSIHITSKDPEAAPLIISRYYDAKSDMKTSVAATRQIRKIFADRILAAYEPEPYVLEACRQFEFNSEEEIKCNYGHLSVGLYHTSGPTAMGGSNDSVTDPRLRVIGVKCMRVIDGGSMPLPVRSNSEQATIALGEKGADMIKESHCDDYE